MNREIKFRAWDEENENMIYVKDNRSIRIFEDGSGEILFHAGADAGGDKCLLRIMSFTPVMQFTGLKDKNGVDIYEGDILDNAVTRWVVVFNKGCFCHKLLSSKEERETEMALRALVGGEVIGNLYSNPELIKQ